MDDPGRGLAQEGAAPDAEPSTRAPSASFLGALRAVRRPLILGHVTPDADCLGAALGVAATLRSLGVQAVAGLPAGRTSERLNFMLDLAGGIAQIAQTAPPRGFDSILVVDTATEKRINAFDGMNVAAVPVLLNLDHHITNTDYGSENWVDPHASSTCEMVARLHGEMGWPVAPRVASLLYAGIHGDTAGFSLPSTTAESLQAAAALVRAGADVSHIGEQLCRSQGRHDFELLRRVYDHTTVVDGGRIAYSYLSHDDIRESGCRAEDIDDQVSIPRALRGVCIAMLFSEGEPGVVRINLRGEGRTTVVELAQKFGGGGHSQSAGVRVRNTPMQEVIERVVTAAQAHLESRPA
jgi:phosphoesterase RecJ-like protein